MQPASHIAIDADVCSGHPRVAGTRIRIANVVLWAEQGLSPEEIVAAYPQLKLADVHAALAFYFDNQLEMDRLINADAQYVEQMQAAAGAGRTAG
jgi:uncharacterized protein (DUF433 family)